MVVGAVVLLAVLIVADALGDDEPDDDAPAEGGHREKKDQSQASLCFVHLGKVREEGVVVSHGIMERLRRDPLAKWLGPLRG